MPKRKAAAINEPLFSRSSLTQRIHQRFQLLQPTDLIGPGLDLQNGLHSIAISRGDSDLCHHLLCFSPTPPSAPDLAFDEIYPALLNLDASASQGGNNLLDWHRWVGSEELPDFFGLVHAVLLLCHDLNFSLEAKRAS